MGDFMKPFEGQTYALFRLVFGLLFIFHGTSKLFGWPTPVPEAPAFVIYVAGILELVGGALIAIGLQTRITAFICSGLMAAAYWMAHGTSALLPINNGGEMAVLYCFAFLFIASKGGGAMSVDGDS